VKKRTHRRTDRRTRTKWLLNASSAYQPRRHETPKTNQFSYGFIVGRLSTMNTYGGIGCGGISRFIGRT